MSELPDGTLIYDRYINDYGIILKSAWTEELKPYFRYYLIHWQNTENYNIDRESRFKWPSSHLHDRIAKGEVTVINHEEKKIKK